MLHFNCVVNSTIVYNLEFSSLSIFQYSAANLLMQKGADLFMVDKSGKNLLHAIAACVAAQRAAVRNPRGGAAFESSRSSSISSSSSSSMDSFREKGSYSTISKYCDNGISHGLLHASTASPHNADGRTQDGELVALANALIDAGVGLNQQDASGSSPLHAACRAGNKKAAYALATRGAEILLRDRVGFISRPLSAPLVWFTFLTCL